MLVAAYDVNMRRNVAAKRIGRFKHTQIIYDRVILPAERDNTVVAGKPDE